MGLTTFARAKEWVGPGYGDCTPSVTGEVVNAVREHFYNFYEQVALFLDVVECYALKHYCFDCHDCRERYNGITLPREAQNAEAMWLNDYPVRIHNSWREYQTGLTPECDCRLSSVEIPGTFCTFDDITPGAAVELVVVALDAADKGKKFKLRGTDAAFRPWEQEFALSTDPQKTNIALRVIEPRGGVIKDVTAGRVVLLDPAGNMYGRYEPDEMVPAYRRLKISGLGDGCANVNIRSARQYFPLYGDDDVVETDNRMAFDAMARYLREYRRVEKTSASLIAEKDHLETARKLMMGQKTRDQGKAAQVDVKIATPAFRGRQLSRFGRGRW